MGKVQVIVGGQFGSEAKGHVAGYLARSEPDLFAIRTGGPNAGHTVYGDDRMRYALRQVPVAAVTNPTAMLGISAGSEIDPAVLQSEADMLEKALPSKVWHRLIIDRQATVIEPGHQRMETSLVESIGSTGKGIGAARADRVMRTAKTWGDITPRASGQSVESNARTILSAGGTVQIEAAQGFGLGLHAGFYPHCTSGDCRAIDAFAAVGLSPWDPLVEAGEIWVVFRTHPIRVAGNSGPLWGETSWTELGLPEEFTTVTQKVRRVGLWDQDLAERAIAANGSDVNIALMMFDQDYPQAGGLTEWNQLDAAAKEALHDYNERLEGRLQLVGTGPETLIDLRKGGI